MSHRLVLVVAAALYNSKGEILLAQRPEGKQLAGLWEFPGGKLEQGEAPEAAVVRECREECGIEVEVVDILDVTHHRYPEKDVLLLFYRCAWIDGEVQHLEVADHAWVEAAEVSRYPLPPADQRVVARITALEL